LYLHSFLLAALYNFRLRSAILVSVSFVLGIKRYRIYFWFH
jgi:hypothetical protein